MPIFIFGFLAAILGVVLFGWANERKIRAELRQNGITTRATIIERERVLSHNQGRRGYYRLDESFYVSYRYDVGDQTYIRRDSVPWGTYYTLAEGTTVEVVYLPTNPQEARLARAL